MIQELESWLFLVSANRYLDYRTVVAPDFMCDNRVTSLLAGNAGGDLVEYKVVHVSNDKVGELTLVFRVMDAIAEDLGIEGQGVLKDCFGREIYLAEGLVFKGQRSESDLTQVQFQEIHNQVKPYYQDFWEWITPQSAIPSESVTRVFDINASKLENNEENTEKQQEYNQLNFVPNSDTLNRLLSWFPGKDKRFKATITSVSFFPDNKRIAVRYEKKQTVEIFDLQFKSFDKWQGESIPIEKLGFPTPVKINSNGTCLTTARIKKPRAKYCKAS